MDGTNDHIEVPSGPHPDEDVAWQLAAADVGGNVVMLAVAIGVLWKWGTGLVNRVFITQAEERKAADDRHEKFIAAQNAERRAADERHEKLATAQAKALEDLTGGLHRVEMAVVRSDEHNQAAINGLRQTMDRHESRLDRVDTRLDDHGQRLVGLEHGALTRPKARGASS